MAAASGSPLPVAIRSAFSAPPPTGCCFKYRLEPHPQHIVFDGAVAYVASGYGSQIEMVKLSTGRLLKTASAPYGSFELDASSSYVVTSSLLSGTLAIYTPQLRLLHTIQIGPAAEDVALTRP